MGELTRNTPKPLLEIKGKTLLEYKLEALPESIDEIVIIIGYLGEQIKSKFGTSFNGKKITYIEERELLGTAKALWQAKGVLKERFLVMMGDDIYSKEAITQCLTHDYSIACLEADRETTGSRVVTDTNGQPVDFETHLLYIRNHPDGGLIFTGLYSMTPEIFKEEMVKMDLSDEWSLPKTFLKLGQKHKISLVKSDYWVSITTPDDLIKYESELP